MNTLYVILSVFIAYASATESNSTTALSGERIANYCYFCSNCPLPFNPSSSWVTQVTTPTGWCAMMSTSSAPGAIATRGAAPPNICTGFGCSWKYVNNVYTYVCCCSTNLCNGDSPMTTTVRPYYPTCYYCSICPKPFNRYNSAVSTTVSPTGWCAKMGASSSIYADYTRGAAPPGVCSWSGCSWKYVNQVYTYVCCCSNSLCNTGVPTSKSVVVVLSTAFMTTVLAFKSF